MISREFEESGVLQLALGLDPPSVGLAVGRERAPVEIGDVAERVHLVGEPLPPAVLSRSPPCLRPIRNLQYGMADLRTLEANRLGRLSLSPRAILAGQVALGLLCLSGASIAANLLLSGAAEPSLPKATFATAEQWPEIKNGVPELISKLPRRGGADPLIRPPVVEEGLIQGLASAPDVAPVVSGVAPPSQTSNEVLRSDADAPPSSPPSQTLSRAEPLALAHQESTDPSAGPTIVESSNPVPLSTGAVTPAIPGPKSSPEVKNPAASNKSGRGAQKGRMAQQARSAGSAQPKARKERTAGSRRTRTAAIGMQTTQGTAAAAAVAPAATEEGPTRVLGIPLPSGRKVKECLLELRC